MALVVVHGVLSDAAQWNDVRTELTTKGHQVIARDRRGRNGVALGLDYGLKTEIEDLHRVLDEAGPDPILFGHSYGAVIALLAAQQRDDLRSVILYEPIATGHQLRAFVGDAPERAKQAVTDGDVEAAMEILVTDVSPTPPDVLPRYRGSRMWQSQLPFVASAVEELQALLAYDLDYDQVAKPAAPAKVVLGARNVGTMPFGRPTETLAYTIGAELVLLGSLGHVAHMEAPIRLAEAISS
ncbi:alpha/beta fold hydrolase [Kibdelosporangium persicum]|uniref:Pimeloyl-ACP methyl ester carboxylesterase n=1 Tax=Kibdelosporangium persicum TaxID=2698649 RepID=A0ABX2EXF7_9PSEU|nr:alpha/beta hydrolase [Kibdelosporangium persicum]NRN63687.1 Pimeloyl-ACP methyl ester carboxylesterase [Kibdelosporangium persicum]